MTIHSIIKTDTGPISLKEKTGISRSELAHAIKNYTHLAPGIVRNLSNYFLLFWSGEFLKRAINNGTVLRHGITYTVIWIDILPEHAYNSPQIRVSFRVPNKEFGLHPCVLVFPIRTANGLYSHD